jgi:D-arabinose 1-dehydrogenase-like Zn-dependent alcohol dehydrogenase
VKISESLSFDAVATFICLRIIVYIPMKYLQMTKPGKILGGLGHMAVKMGKYFGLQEGN